MTATKQRSPCELASRVHVVLPASDVRDGGVRGLRSLLAATVTTAFLAAPGRAQDSIFIATGDLVRAAHELPNRMPSWIEGLVVSVNADQLVLARAGSSARLSPPSLALEWSWINRLQLSRGRGRKTVTGIAVGILVGAPVGATAGWIRDTGVNDLTTRESVHRGLRLGVLIGAVLGSVIGTLIEVERWEDVSDRSVYTRY